MYTLVFFSLILAYCMGSVSSAIIVSKLFALPDPRQEGSKNPGATNVLRLAGKKYAALVLLADMLKGILPVLIAKTLGLGQTALGFICLAAVIGHIYPIFFRFKGGKGVATSIGAFLALQFMLGVYVIAVWLLVVSFIQYASLASILALAFSPILSLFAFHNANVFFPLTIITFLVIYKHKENITKLMQGRESKIHIKRSVLQDIFSDKNEIKPPHPGAETDMEEEEPKAKK